MRFLEGIIKGRITEEQLTKARAIIAKHPIIQNESHFVRIAVARYIRLMEGKETQDGKNILWDDSQRVKKFE